MANAAAPVVVAVGVVSDAFALAVAPVGFALLLLMLVLLMFQLLLLLLSFGQMFVSRMSVDQFVFDQTSYFINLLAAVFYECLKIVPVPSRHLQHSLMLAGKATLP